MNLRRTPPLSAALVLTLSIAQSACFQGELQLGRIEATQQCPFGVQVDTDGDGVCDGADLCPGDDNADADGDGVCDSRDTCPGGDEVDADGDGVCDMLDRCPGEDDNADADRDGVCDAADQCPGEEDSYDLDEDGIPDCIDLCNFDGPRVAPLVDFPVGAQRYGVQVNGIDINGDGRIVKVRPGARLRFTMDLRIINCDCDTCEERLWFGFAHREHAELCAWEGVPGCAERFDTVDFELTAPAEAGEYSIRTARRLALDCGSLEWATEGLITPLDDIAIICVEER